jgi:hypothetical protein
MSHADRTPRLVLARLKYWAWEILTKGILGVIYISVIAEGLRRLVPALGQRLYRLPGLGALREYEATYRLDLAPFLAVFILIAVWYLWDEILQLWLRRECDDDESPWNRANHGLLIVSLGIVILGSDAVLFYIAMTQIGWQGAGFSFPALLATVAYLAVLIFVSFVSINLREAVNALSKEK